MKRIVKTGVLAVVVTAAFAFFAFRLADWSLNSGVAVQGQTVNPVCSPGNGNAAAVQTVKVIPQIALGSFDGGLTKYATFIQIVNTTGSSQNIAANFYKQDGTPLNNAGLTAGAATIANGILQETSIAKDGIYLISGGGTGAQGVIGWGRIAACSDLTISAFFELRDGRSNVLYSRVGVAASPANMSNFVIPRIREVTTGLDVGFALVNTAPEGAATLKVELRDATGNVLAMQDVSMAARSQKALFTKDLFPSLTEQAGRSYQYLRFAADSPTFSASALAFEGPSQTSFPVDLIR